MVKKSHPWRGSLLFAILLLMMLINGAPRADAGAFMIAEGESEYSTGITFASAKDFFNRSRHRVAQLCGRSRDIYWSHGYTYGYSYYYNFFANTTLIHRSCTTTQTISGLGNAVFGVRGRLDETRNGRTWEVSLTIPTGYDSHLPNRLGFGVLGLWGGIAWSTQNTGWEEQKPTYWEFGTGIQYWFGFPATQWRSYAKWSARLDEGGLNRFVAGAALRLSMHDYRPEPTPLGGHRFPGNSDAFVPYASLQHTFSPSISGHATIGDTIWGRNTSASWYTSLGVTYKWD